MEDQQIIGSAVKKKMSLKYEVGQNYGIVHPADHMI